MTPTSVVTNSELDRPTQRESRWLIALVFIGIALRIILMMVRASDLKTDPDGYVAHAETLLQNGQFCVPGTEHPTAFRPPLYPILLAALMLVGLKASVAVALINLASTALLIIATWWMARVAGLRGRWPNIAAAAAGCDPLLIRYSVLPMTETISAAFLAVGLLKMYRLWIAQTDNSFVGSDLGSLATNEQLVESPLRSAVAAGMCFGLGGLCRPVILLTCAVVSAVTMARTIFLWERFRNPATRRRTVALSFVPALVATAVLMPWVVRNAIVFQHFIPATTHGGYTLLLANNPVFYQEVVQQPGQPAWQGESLDRWQQQMIQEMRNGGIELDSETDADRWQYQKAIQYIGGDRIGFLHAVELRWKRFWALRPSVEQANSPAAFTMLAAVWYGIVFVRLAVSLLLCMFRRVADIHVLWWAILSFLLLHSFYWTNTRMRAPLAAAIVILSVAGWRFLYDQTGKISRGTSTVNQTASARPPGYSDLSHLK